VSPSRLRAEVGTGLGGVTARHICDGSRSSTVSRALSYGTIYTTKLLRRGTDIDRTTPWRALQDLKVSDAMQAFQPPFALTGARERHTPPTTATLPGPVTGELDPQAIFATESLAQALRQLEIYGRDGLPVLSDDAQRITGWVTNTAVIGAVARQIWAAHPHPADESAAAQPSDPLPEYRVVEITVPGDSPSAGQRLNDLTWPPGYLPVSLFRDQHLGPPAPDLIVRSGDRIALLVEPPS
jgi:CIC family chloride channel protein